MKILFALAGLHRVDRGAEVVFISLASQLARAGDKVTLIGSGPQRPGAEYRYIRAPAMRREWFERWPTLPMFRNETAWEEASFGPGLLSVFRPGDYDVTVTCAYPWTSWALRRPTGGYRPKHVFVTQNGDWPAYANNAEFRFFDCDGLVCTNPDFLERNSERYRSTLIPNGIDTGRFTPGPAERERLGFPTNGRVVLMVSALIASKNVEEAIRAVAQVPDANLVVAGDGPLREQLKQVADEVMPGRYKQLTVPPAEMPALYRSADAFLHLSRDEPFGNVYLEAMACGKPVIGIDLPRTRWIVGDGAFLADPDDPSDLVRKIEAGLAASASSPDAFVKRAREFDWSNIARRYRTFLEEVVAA
ncbi:glycosyltransferase family 4 protein [Sphingomonas sp. SM33]|uniref:Glycosyltransferase family 4 protein n=1 Tax=Sphingomonas telluris TaxID=2907998 RepID=A0ABS9VJI8_9SPHN|nr:glycosyltransferase family 4 protein [Sphingomonas telluris]